jgi:eukaryotic-like serine/threonine-protein kinase
VQLYSGILVANAKTLVTRDGFEPQVVNQADDTVQPGYVIKQDPTEGSKVARGSVVTLYVSTGKPKVPVPDVVGKSLADAVAILTAAKLDAHPVDITSDQPAGTITATDPRAGTVVVAGSRVRINVAKGPAQVLLPDVRNLTYDTAASQLQSAGFAVRRNDVDSDQPAGTVLDQSPSGGTLQAKNSSVTLTVSKGPATQTVPDVTNLDVATARATLIAAGFRVRTVFEATTDPTQGGQVLSQIPGGNTQAKPNATVTITVGQLSANTTPATTPTTPLTTPTTTP